MLKIIVNYFDKIRIIIGLWQKPSLLKNIQMVIDSRDSVRLQQYNFSRRYQGYLSKCAKDIVRIRATATLMTTL